MNCLWSFTIGWISRPKRRWCELMGKKTIIAWTEHTWNPWRGCTRVSAGCDNCYMFRAQERYGLDPSVVVRTKTMTDPLRWQRAAERAGRKEMVFTCSWSDWFHRDADDWRDEAWAIIRQCPNLIFQILTKRAGRIASHLPPDWNSGYQNVWLGVSIEANAYSWRLQYLRRVPAVIRFVSAEPLLEDISAIDLSGIDQVIVGGESGPGFRPMDHAWARSLRQRCQTLGIAYFFKQSSAARTESGIELDGEIIREYPQPRMRPGRRIVRQIP
jgi:protein gp37